MARSVNHALPKAKKLAKNGGPKQTEQLHKGVREGFPSNKRDIEGHRLPNSPKASPTLSHAELPQDRLNALIALFNQRRLEEVVRQATSMAAEFPNAVVLYNILGAANAGLRKLNESIASYGKALQIKPDYAQAHNNLGCARATSIPIRK